MVLSGDLHAIPAALSGGQTKRNGTMSEKRERKGKEGGAAVARRDTTNVFALSYRVLNILTIELERLVVDTGARCALVIDRTGCIMASAGEFGSLNPSSLGATAAATVAALNSMVARASSPEVSVDFYGADVDRIHFVVLEERLVLCLIHSRKIASGNIRTASRSFVDSVATAIAEDRRHKPDKKEREVVKSVQYIESKLDELFQDYVPPPDDD